MCCILISFVFLCASGFHGPKFGMNTFANSLNQSFGCFVLESLDLSELDLFNIEPNCVVHKVVSVVLLQTK